MSFDILILNGKLVDGTGNPWIRADIGIKDGKIDKIGRLRKSSANDVIDASGLIVSPGFIDVHSHADFGIPFDPRCESLVQQGITTVVVGLCGSSNAPMNPQRIVPLKKLLASSMPPGHELNFTWNSFTEYLAAMEQIGCAINAAHLVGFGTVRIAGGPGYEDRPPTLEEMDSMKSYITEAMQAGAFGMSTGLIYTPQIYANMNEVIELTKVIADYQGIYFSHIRSEGATVVEAVQEAIDITEKSGCNRCQIAHHKIFGKSNWGKSLQTLRLIEEANHRGINVTCDQYPYLRGMTSLITVLPPWTHQGGVEKILGRLQNPDDQERIKQDINAGSEGWDNFIADCGWNHIYISTVKTDKWKAMLGKSLAEITSLKKYPDEFTTLFELLIDENTEVSITDKFGHEDDLYRIIRGRYTMIVTDAWSAAPEGILSHGKPHPRFYGTYPRVLGNFVREKQVLDLETAIKKMTSFPAQRLGLRDRGILRIGTWADLVIFDPSIILDKATYEDPHQFPVGINYVLVNGQIVVEMNEQSTVLPGQILRYSIS